MRALDEDRRLRARIPTAPARGSWDLGVRRWNWRGGYVVRSVRASAVRGADRDTYRPGP